MFHAIVLGYHPELDTKIPLLKTVHIGIIEHRAIKLVLTLKFHLYWTGITLLTVISLKEKKGGVNCKS